MTLEELTEILTERELEVLYWVMKGKSNKEIAVILFISDKTVESHMENITKKLDIIGRVRAAVLASEAGLGISGSYL